MELNTDLNWPAAPSWAIFTGELGRWLILLGVASFCVSFLGWTFLPSRPRPARIAFAIGCSSLVGAIVCLGFLFVKEQFEFNTVKQSIETGLPIKYRVAAIWAHQEGSFLLWGTTSAIFGLLTVGGTGIYRRWYTVAYSGFLAGLCGILAYETPFKLILTHGKALIPPNGAGLTPSLQNYWVVIHPPTIFTGFGSLTVLACYAFAAMLTGNFSDWTKMVRPWALISVSILGLGLCMGGFWAYETLGWGGFWAWDPVENVSFVPWILAVTLVHGIIVQTAKKRWIRANLLLGGMPFLAFVYGTFLTRSGMYADVSVHSFAQMDNSALKILLGFLVASVVGFLGVWIWKTRGIETPESKDKQANREGLYRSGMLMVGGIGVATGIGMSVPLIMSLLGQKAKVVEEHLYHQVLVWPFIPLLLLMAIAPYSGWRTMGWKVLIGRTLSAASVAFFFLGLTLFLVRGPWVAARSSDLDTIAFPYGIHVPTLPWILFLLYLAYFALVANAWRIGEVVKRSKMSIGGFLAHMGVATLMAGMILSRGLERKEVAFVQEGQPAQALGYTIAYKGQSSGILDRENKALFDVVGADRQFEARAGLYYTVGDDGGANAMTWPHIEHGPAHDIYLALHAPETELWKQPLSILPGKTVEQDHVRVTYEKMVMEGKPGQIGVKFGARLRIRTQEGEFVATPTLQLTPGGLQPNLAPIDGDLLVAIQGINAGDQSALIQILFAKPVYPIEVFYKPMTILVWLGAGILTLGGLLSAWYRRCPKPLSAGPAEAEPSGT